MTFQSALVVFGGLALVSGIAAAFYFTYRCFRQNQILRRAILSSASVGVFIRYWPFQMFWIGILGSPRYVRSEHMPLVVEQRWNGAKWLLSVLVGAVGGALQDYAMQGSL